MSVPALVASTPDDIAGLPMEQRGAIITQALEESKSWLAVATKGTDPTPIAEFKAWAATVAEMTRQKGLAQDIQLDALEMVRRAERGIGVAIRNGQETGEIRGRGDATGPRGAYERNGRAIGPPREPNANTAKFSPTDFASASDLSSNNTGIYSLTDDVTDDEFEESLTEARAEHNLSRANVARKARGKSEAARLNRAQKADKIRELADQGYSSRQMAKPMATTDSTIRDIAREYQIDIRADRVAGRGGHNINAARVIGQTVLALEGLRQGLRLIGPEDLDGLTPEQIGEWLPSLNESMRDLRNIVKEMKNRA